MKLDVRLYQDEEGIWIAGLPSGTLRKVLRDNEHRLVVERALQLGQAVGGSWLDPLDGDAKAQPTNRYSLR